MKTKMTSKDLNHRALEKVTDRLSGGKIKLKPVLHRIIRDMSSEAYHSSEGTWSSSQFKDMNEDEEIFIRKYIKKEIERSSSEAFDTGTYFHTGVLEPHKVQKEIAVYQGKTRYGKEWDSFISNNKGKTIITMKQKEIGDGMIRAVQKSPVSMSYLEGDPEVSFFVELTVWNGNIYALHFGKKLTRNGWVDFKGKIEKGFKIIVKVRADCLGDTFISDLKSTSGRANKQGSVRQSISKYNYDLSAALYLDLFSLIRPKLTSFIWIFASKENPCAASWNASEKNILVGRCKWMRAVKRMADLSAAKWEVVDYLREAEPLPHELEWLDEKDKDLL